MNKQMKIALAGIIILLLSACGQALTTPAPVITQVPGEGETTQPPVSGGGLAPEKYSKYVGMNYPPLPEGLFEDMGMIIQDSNEYSLSLISEGESKMLWLSKLTHRDADGIAYWQVQDILDLSDVEAGVNLVPDGCLLNGVPDSEILVISKDATILQAWRANTNSNVFEVIPMNGIECHSDKALSL